MTLDHVHKEILADGSIQLRAGSGAFSFTRLRRGVLLVKISGNDTGQFGAAALDEIRMEMLRHSPVELFIDAADATNVTVNVSQDWTHFFAQNRDKLKRVSVLTGSKLIHLTVEIAQHLSKTGKLIQIYSDPELFREIQAR